MSESLISIDFHLFDAKLTAALYTFGEPGSFATVDLLAEGEGQGPKLKLFFKNTAYAQALAYAINAAGAQTPSTPVPTKHLHTEAEQ